MENNQEIYQIGNYQEKNTKGTTIASIIVFVISFILLAICLITYIDVMTSKDKVLSWLAYLLTIGWMTYIPGLILSVTSVILGSLARKSTIPKQKKLANIFFLLSLILLALYVLFIIIFVVVKV